jgi:hypothetical protein
MKRGVSLLIVGLIVLLGTSFTEAYNHLPENHGIAGSNAAEHAEFDKIYMNPVDFPQQQGDIRILKEVTQKVRNGEDDVVSFVTLTKGLFLLDLVERSNRIYPNDAHAAIIHTKRSRCITFRSLLI